MCKVGLMKLTQAVGDIMEYSQLPSLVESVKGTQLRSNVTTIGNLEDDVVNGGKGLGEARNYDRSGIDPTHNVRHATTGASFHDVSFKEERGRQRLDCVGARAEVELLPLRVVERLYKGSVTGGVPLRINLIGKVPDREVGAGVIGLR
jgi:hypothetical protein